MVLERFKKTGSVQPKRKGFLTSLAPAKLRRFSQDEKGVTAIEFSVVAIPFFMLLFGLIEFGLAFFMNRMLDRAALETTRLIRTGQALQNGLSEEDFRSTFCTNMILLCNSDLLTVDIQTSSTFEGLSDIDPLVDEDGEIEDDTSYNIGSSSDIVIARFIYKWPMKLSVFRTDSGDTGNGYRLLYSTVVFRNEPFPW